MNQILDDWMQFRLGENKFSQNEVSFQLIAWLDKICFCDLLSYFLYSRLWSDHTISSVYKLQISQP